MIAFYIFEFPWFGHVNKIIGGIIVGLLLLVDDLGGVNHAIYDKIALSKSANFVIRNLLIKPLR